MDERFHAQAKFGEVDVGVGATEEPGVAELLEALVAGGGGQTNGGGELLIG